MKFELPELAIEVKQVKKYFKDVKAVDGVDLSIKRGEYLALLGPNGAGKTTLVEMIEGLLHPDSGDILIGGINRKQAHQQLQHLLGISLQETRFIDKLNVWETLKLFGSFYDLKSDQLEYVLELVNLKEKRKAFTVNLSGGQRQRLALGVSLLNEPPILILDEPTTGLDPTARHEIWDILLRLKREKNTTMILTTHYMEEAEKLCDRIVVLDQGKVLAKGSLKELLDERNMDEAVVFSFTEPCAALPLEHCPGFVKLEWEANRVSGKILVKDIVGFLPEFLAVVKSYGLELKALECRKMTLDDLFIAMTGRRLDE